MCWAPPRSGRAPVERARRGPTDTVRTRRSSNSRSHEVDTCRGADRRQGRGSHLRVAARPSPGLSQGSLVVGEEPARSAVRRRILRGRFVCRPRGNIWVASAHHECMSCSRRTSMAQVRRGLRGGRGRPRAPTSPVSVHGASHRPAPTRATSGYDRSGRLGSDRCVSKRSRFWKSSAGESAREGIPVLAGNGPRR